MCGNIFLTFSKRLLQIPVLRRARVLSQLSQFRPSSRTSVQDPQTNDKQGGAGSDAVASGDGPSPRQSARANVQPMADTASTPPDKDEIVIGGRRYVSSKRLASMWEISLTTLSRRCAAGKAPPKIKISGDYFELPEG
jgi:hypothetical protein